MLALGKLIEPEEYLPYLAVADSLPMVKHAYGESFSTLPKDPCQMQYDLKDGYISFTRNTWRNPVLREMVDKVVELLTPIFPGDIMPRADRVHIMKTCGVVPPHKDEAGRACCINIGIKDTSNAVTRENFPEPTDSTIVEGYGYLLNTAEIHSVHGIDEPRYLITYGFAFPYRYISKWLKSQK